MAAADDPNDLLDLVAQAPGPQPPAPYGQSAHMVQVAETPPGGVDDASPVVSVPLVGGRIAPQVDKKAS